MLCKKCKTAVSEGEQRCPLCGARLRRGRRLKQVAGITAACVIGLSCCTLMYLDSVGLAPWNAEEAHDAHEAEPGDVPTPSAPPVDDTEPTPTPSATADLQKAMEDVWAMLESAYGGAALYMAAHETESAFVSQNGYLYQAAAGEYVTAKRLIDANVLDARHAGDKIMLLYLRPVDAAVFAEVSLGESDAFALFAAYETQDGVALFGEGNAQGVLYRESMNMLLARYASAHGTVRRLSAEEETYTALRGLVEAAVNAQATGDDAGADSNENETGIDIRYMAADERFACIVASGKASSERLQAYIAEFSEESGWALLPLAYEEGGFLAAAVNRIVPEMPATLLPDYEPDRVPLLPAAYYAFITDFMLSQGTVTEADMPVDFVSGNDEAVYMVFRSGLCFFGRYSMAAEGWPMFPVQNWMGAELLMRSAGKSPATYILRQE